MHFKLADTNRYYLPNTKGQFTHLATVHYGVREFIYFADNIKMQSWVEEITGGGLREIEDDELWNTICAFLKERKIGMIENHGKR
tara:strand:+ start:16950 stop:17204 length:255 start_codon:yes stop_codon:yes gene_type:complete